MLILVDGPADHDRKAALRQRLYEVELSTDEVLSPMVFSQEDWASPAYQAMPLHQQIEREGTYLASTRGEASGLPAARRTDQPDKIATEKACRDLHASIKEAVEDVEPEAHIILYGSRARGEAQDDSDWDLLILVDGPVDPGRKDAICHRLYEVEWKMDEVLCPMVRSRQDWDSALFRATPFHQNVDRDGVVL